MPEAPPLRRILLRSIVALNVLAVLLFAVPLAFVVWSTYRSEAIAALEREATRTLALTTESDLHTIPAPMDPAVTIGVYAPSGALIAGSGPATDVDALGALGDGVTHVVDEGEELAVYVPFRREGGSAVTIRAAVSLSEVRDRTLRAWTALTGLILLSVTVSAAVALRRSTRLAEPFERLATAAHDLRVGAFAVSIPGTGVREGDEVARALESAAQSTAERVDAAHALAEDASHQVRTPIAAAQLTLESALAIPGSDLRQAATTAVEQLDRASGALSEVLALRRRAPSEAPSAAAAVVLRETANRWAGVLAAVGRTCTLEAAGVPPSAEVTEAVLRQALDVLLDNSLAHGAGPVRVQARVAGDWLLVDVGDDGAVTGAPEELFVRGQGRGSGLGLSLARSLAESVGGRLVLADAAPTRFTLALPVQESA